MVSPGCTLTGTLTDTQGNTLQAVVTLTLCNFGASPALISGSNLFAQLQISVTSATNGTFSIPFYGNSQISPAGTYYNVTIQPVGANQSFNLSTLDIPYQFLASGTFDISTLQPMTSYPNPIVSPNYLTFSYEEVPQGTLNGINATFTLDFTPAPLGSLNLFVNGVRQTRGIAFTLTGNTVTYAAGYIPGSSDTHVCYYTFNA